MSVSAVIRLIIHSFPDIYEAVDAYKGELDAVHKIIEAQKAVCQMVMRELQRKNLTQEKKAIMIEILEVVVADSSVQGQAVH